MTIPADKLKAIEHHFHELILSRAGELVHQQALELPQLSGFLSDEVYFPVPGMHGGFSYRFEDTGVTPALIVKSWNRVVDGSEQAHEITEDGIRPKEDPV